MSKKIAVVAAIALSATASAFAAPSFDAYVEQDTDSKVAYGVGTSYEGLRLDLEGDYKEDKDGFYAYYVTAGYSEKIALGNGFSFTPKVEYGVDFDKDFNKTFNTTNFQGMFGYAFSDTLAVRAGTQYRFQQGGVDQARIKAGVNYQVSDALNVDYDLELRDEFNRGGVTTSLSDYRVRNELRLTATAVPFVEPYAVVGHTTAWETNGLPADTYAIVGLSVAF